MSNQSMETANQGYNITATINNIEISYDDVGEGRIPVIFLHGFPFDKSMWHLQLDYLQSFYRLISVDLRGFGSSKDEETPLSMDLLADDLIKFMDHLQIEKAVICGLSMGGYIAINAIEKFQDRFEALVLCDTQCKADTPDAKQKRYEAIEEVKANGVGGFVDGFVKKVFSKEALKTKKKLVNQLKAVMLSNSPHIITEGLKAIAERKETCTGLANITVPTLIICGSDDVATPVALSEYMQEKIKGSTLKVINQAGHVSNLEQPDEFNKHLNEFLKVVGGVGVEMFSWN